jgi:CBS domain-containing protein
MLASDIMTRDVVTIAPDADIAEAVTLMIQHRISALPVVRDGAVVGIVSEGDLLRRAETATEPKRSRWLEFLTAPETVAADYIRSHARLVEQIMSAPAITVEAEADIADVAALLESKGIKRVPVMWNGALVGIISRANLLQALASRLRPMPAADRSADRKIHAALEAELAGKPWAPAAGRYNIVVEDGVVHLWGWLSAGVERTALVVAAQNVAGVKQVVDHLLAVPPSAL